jgi:hypothetical protein
MHTPPEDPADPRAVVDLTWRDPERTEPDELDRIITDATQQ